MITRNNTFGRIVKYFTTIELCEIAKKANELVGMPISNDCMSYGNEWHLSEDVPECRFDYCPAYSQVIDLAFMLKWDELRKWVELAFGCSMTLHIGTRGEYEDATTCICITPTENLAR